MSSPKFNGTYTFQDDLLVYHTTSITVEGKTEQMDGAKSLRQQYKAVLDGDRLTLSQVQGQREAPAEEYNRQ